MRKPVLALVAIIALSLVLAACGGADEPVAPRIIERTVVVEKEVIKEVQVEKVVEKEVIHTVVVEKVLIATPTLPPAGTPQFGGDLKVVSQASINSLDPTWTGAYVTIAVSQHLYETTFGWDSSLVEQPRMVKSWSLSPDNLTYTLTLRDGLKFHDGSNVDSEDVVVSLRRWLNGPSASAGMLRDFSIDNPLATVDGDTLTLTLKEPFSGALEGIARPHQSAFIHPKEIASAPHTEGIEDWTGTAVFKFREWEPGHQIILERFEGYIPRNEPGDHLVGETIAYIDTVTWLEVPDEETKIAGLETGEWDVVDGAGFDFFKRLKANPDMVIPLYKPGHRSGVVLNPTKPPFSDVKVRQAIQAGVDIEQIMASLGDSDLWTLCPAIYYCGTPNETFAGEEFFNQADMAKAKRLLAESSYDGSPVFLMNPTDYATITPLGIVLKPMMEDIGFDVDMPAMDWSSIVANINQAIDEWDGFTTWQVHWSAGDPITDHTGASTRNLFPHIPRLAELRLEYARELDPARRRQILDEFQIGMYENVQRLWLGQFFSIYPHHKDLKNFEVKAIPWYGNAWLEGR